MASYVDYTPDPANEEFRAAIRESLPTILANIPQEWRGTTFKNSKLLGRETFAANFKELILKKRTSITSEDLVALGNAEDYLRVSSNMSCLLEMILASERETDISRVFTFASRTMPIVAVLLATNRPVHYFVGECGMSPFSEEELQNLRKYNTDFHVHHSTVKRVGDEVILSSIRADEISNVIDAVVYSDFLCLRSVERITPAMILTMRKRTSTPMITPMAEIMLKNMAEIKITEDPAGPPGLDVYAFYDHLQELSGAAVDRQHSPVCFTAGLPSICSLWSTLIFQDGADVVMASTAYGGSSELTDILTTKAHDRFHKHTFDITGKNDIVQSIQTALNDLAANPASLLPRTVLFVEIPTNPDMKVPDIEILARMLQQYKGTTGKDVLLLVDTTFAPGSKVLQKIRSVAEDLTAMVFISLSKSVSRGLTTAGCLVAGDSSASKALLEKVRRTACSLDTTARGQQLVALALNHTGVEDRCQRAYAVACDVGTSLCDAVRTYCNGHNMELAFVTPENTAIGFTSSTFSFNLPPVPGGSSEDNAALAQRFVDLLTEHKEFKPCVSFGQDNGLVYATVPATSTQGAIKAEHKAKQAVGGVQLTRLSFPPSCDVAAVCAIITDAVKTCYAR